MRSPSRPEAGLHPRSASRPAVRTYPEEPVAAWGKVVWPPRGAAAKPATIPSMSPSGVGPRGGEGGPAMAHKQWSSPPPMQIDGSRQYVATLETTKGPIKVRLLVGEAPST